MKTQKSESHSEQQAQAQLESIKEMVAALECDYDRLEELKAERADLESEAKDYTNVVQDEARQALADWDKENGEELKDLIDAASCGDVNYPCESREDAEQRIQEDPLSVQVRSDWHSPGERGEDSDFEILLCTGGPAVRIIGELSNGEPSRCWLEHQDWGTPWQEYITTGSDHEALLTYARCFYFGE